MPKHIELIARGIIIRDQRLLVCVAIGGYCYLPGGHIEFGESAEVALKRELVEECGQKIDVGDLLACHEHTFHATKSHHELNLTFRCRLLNPRAVIVSREPEVTFAWLDQRELKAADLRPAAMKHWLHKVWKTLLSNRPLHPAWIPQTPSH